MALSWYFVQGSGCNHKEHSVKELVVQDPQKLCRWLTLPSSAVSHLHCRDTNCPVHTEVSKLWLKKRDASAGMGNRVLSQMPGDNYILTIIPIQHVEIASI